MSLSEPGSSSSHRRLSNSVEETCSEDSTKRRRVALLRELNPTDDLISDMKHEICKRTILADEYLICEEARKKVVKYNEFVKHVNSIMAKIGPKWIDDLFRKMFDDDIVLQCIKTRSTVISLNSSVVDVKEISLYEDGFRKQNMECQGLRYTYYHKDPLRVIEKQVNMVDKKNIFTTPDPDEKEPNPVHSTVGQLSISAIRRQIEIHSDTTVRWYDKLLDGEESMVAFLQLYSDKSKTTMKVNGLTFYPFHVVLMNFKQSVL